MSYPKVKLAAAVKELELTPEFLREVARQLPCQLKCMTFTEMLALWNASKEIGTELSKAPGVADIIKLFRH